MSNLVEEFNAYREKMNHRILEDNNKIIKRIFNLDTNAFQSGSLDLKTKELLGLVASMVLRCDDCVKYHLETCYKEGVKKEGSKKGGKKEIDEEMRKKLEKKAKFYFCYERLEGKVNLHDFRNDLRKIICLI